MMRQGTQLMFAMLMAMLVAVSALAQSADELVQMIQEDMEDIELQIPLAPTSAEENLTRQRERLDALRSEAPDHPMLSSLERRVDELGEEVATALANQSEVAPEEEQFVPLSVPAEVRMRLRDVEQLQTRSDREMMLGQMDSAAGYLDESETLIEEIEEEYGDQIPPAYAALIVAKERLAALREQLDRQQAE